MAARTDYILRIFDQLSAFVGQIASLILSGRNLEAEAMIDSVIVKLLGIGHIDALPDSDPDLVRYLGTIEDTDVLFLLIRLIIQKALIALSVEDRRGFDLLMRKAYITASEYLGRGSVDADRKDAIYSQLRLINASMLDRDQTMGMFGFYKLIGCWGAAEDMLYHLKADGYLHIEEIIKSYYQELLDKTDESLLRGNLPRDEIERDLRALEGRASAESDGIGKSS